MEIIVKPATIKDVKALSAIAQLTFPLAGPENSCKKEIAKYIKKSLNESVFQKLVKNDDIFIACAYSSSELIGFIVMKHHRGLNKIESSAELQRLYVLKEYHGTNTAKSLVSEVLKECSIKSIATISLNVYSENIRAKKFYSKFGFKETGTTYFKMGNEKHLDNIMVANIAKQ